MTKVFFVTLQPGPETGDLLVIICKPVLELSNERRGRRPDGIPFSFFHPLQSVSRGEGVEGAGGPSLVGIFRSGVILMLISVEFIV